MGGAVSSGESNDELIDNLCEGSYIKSRHIERVFRAVDRGLYYTDPYKSTAYKDLAWKDGYLHLSAPCIYSEVMENLELDKGMSFLNMGSGTGYLSTMCGLLIGKGGINHGIELFPEVVEYARDKLEEFMKVSPAVDLFDFCIPQFAVGNCLDQLSNKGRYDRIYCGAACPEESVKNVTDLLKIGGICVLPVNDSLVQITKTSEVEVENITKSLLSVSFATLIGPRFDANSYVSLPEWNPLSLKESCRFEIRSAIRAGFMTAETEAEANRNEPGNKKKRRRSRRNIDRCASRLLVVQRRRTVEEGGDGGFVAVAYSIGHSSSGEEADEGQDEIEEMRMRASSGSDNDNELPDLENDEGEIIPNPDASHRDGESESTVPQRPRNRSSSNTPRNRGNRNVGAGSRRRSGRITLNRVRTPTLGAGAVSGRDVDPASSENVFGRFRELYRRGQLRTEYRTILNPEHSSNASTSRSIFPNSSGSGAFASRSSGGELRTSTSRRGQQHDTEDSAVSSPESSVESSQSPSSTISTSYEEGVGHVGLAVPPTGKNGTYDGRVVGSAESGIGTDSPGRIREQVEDEEEFEIPISGACRVEDEEQEQDEEQETDYSPEAKLKKNLISRQMMKKISQLSLPPPIKLYLNYYRNLELE